MGPYVHINVSALVPSADHHISSLIKAIKDNSEGICDCSDPCSVVWAIFDSFDSAICTNMEGNFPLCKMIHSIFLHICFVMTQALH